MQRKRRNRVPAHFRFDPELNDQLKMVAHKMQVKKTTLVEVGLRTLFKELREAGEI